MEHDLIAWIASCFLTSKHIWRTYHLEGFDQQANLLFATITF